MARNRKNESAAARFAPALKALLLCSFFVTAGVGYVWYKSQTKILGDQVKACENRLGELQRLNQLRRDQLAALCLPAALEARVKKSNLGLGPPANGYVIRLDESSPEPLPPGGAERPASDRRPGRAGTVERGY